MATNRSVWNTINGIFESARGDLDDILAAINVPLTGTWNLFKFLGKGLKKEGDGAAVDAMRDAFGSIDIKGSIIIGEGASGGAIGIGVGDKVLMLENTWYSVISPESCSSILWRSWDHKEKAAEALKLTATDMKKNGLIDGIIKEPLGGAHAQPELMFEEVKKAIIKHTKTLSKLNPEDLVEQRMEKFFNMGVYAE